MKFLLTILFLSRFVFLSFGQADSYCVESPSSAVRVICFDSLTNHDHAISLSKPKYSRPIAFKTNLLYNAATIVNVAMEIPLTRHMSLSADILFPWWLSEKHQHALQINATNIEARYWINPVSKVPLTSKNHHSLTGWFTGLYAGAGLYDLEWNRSGVQGGFFIATGVTGGYATPLSRNVNLEFSLGLGYLTTRYRKYEATEDAAGEWHLFKQQEGWFNWLGPTKANISLVWYPHFKKKGDRH